MQFEVVTNDRAALGESPLWSPREGALYWIDTRGPTIMRLHLASGERRTWGLPSTVGAIALRRVGGLLLATKHGVATLDADGTFALLHDPEPELPAHRLNDGKVDRAGRFWFGTMEDDARTPTGRLYRYDADGTSSAHDEGFTIPNGQAWSPDNRRMYCADSRRSTIYVYDFDLAGGTLANRRVFVRTPDGDGFPDGATVDAQGYLWSARINASAIVRYAPDGSEDRRVTLPMSRPTSVAFGGPDLCTLFVTTGYARLSAEQLAAQPLAGALLALRLDVPGVPEPEFAG
jgi:sugar lactone lactonase YvrE